MNELLKITGLVVRFYTYDGVVQAVDNIDLGINPSETFGLVGESGCGKTVTSLAILRLIRSPGNIESGSIYFQVDHGQPLDLLALSEEQIRQIRGCRISMIFQEPSTALNPLFTIGDQITEVIFLHRKAEITESAIKALNLRLAEPRVFVNLVRRPIWQWEKSLYQKIVQNPNAWQLRIVRRVPLLRRMLNRIKDEAGKMAVSVLKDVEIPDAERIFRQHPHQLSGGMKQRAVIAMALACSPKLLIADEPTTSLDVTIQAQIIGLLNRLKVEKEASILYITHDLAVAAELCDRIGVMYAGSLCEVGGVEEMYASPLHPYTQALLDAVPKPGVEPKAIGGFLPNPINLPPGCKFNPRCPRAMDKCRQQRPERREVAAGHSVWCHLY